MASHQHHGAEKVFKASVPLPNAVMNITPMIDVLLVLLVIFMASLPLNQRGLDVNLPADAEPSNPREVIDRHIVVEYTSEKHLSINKQDVALGDLEERLRSIFEDRRDKTMFIMAAGTLHYGDIVDIIDAAKGAGVARVGIVTESMRHQ